MKISLLLTSVLLLAGCSVAKQPQQSGHGLIGMPNPAAVYCAQQGGKSITVDTQKGVQTDCLLPSGERIDEWTLYRREHSPH